MTAAVATTEPTELDRRNHRKIARAGWALYDFADTIWSYAIFSRAISLFLVDRLGDSQGNLWLGLSVALSVGANALVSPFLGALSDRYGRRLPFLAAFTVGACLPAMAVPFVPVPLGIALFCLAMFSYQSSPIYYDASLELVSTSENRGRIASLSTGVGYMGTVFIALLLLLTDLSVEMTFVVAPILFPVLAAPTFVLLREDDSRRRRDADPRGAAWAQTWRTVRSPDRHPGLGRFLASRFFCTDALNTSVTIMTICRVKAVGFTEREASVVLLVLTLSAIVSAFAWGNLVERFGPAPYSACSRCGRPPSCWARSPSHRARSSWSGSPSAPGSPGSTSRTGCRCTGSARPGARRRVRGSLRRDAVSRAEPPGASTSTPPGPGRSRQR